LHQLLFVIIIRPHRKNGWTDQDAAWDAEWGGPRNHVLDGALDPPWEGPILSG